MTDPAGSDAHDGLGRQVVLGVALVAFSGLDPDSSSVLGLLPAPVVFDEVGDIPVEAVGT